MDENFVLSDTELIEVLKSAREEELKLLLTAMKKAFSFELDESCRDVMLIADELQKLGGNTIANKIRGHGVKYREIVADVANKLDAKVRDKADIDIMEWQLCEHVLKQAHKSLNKKDRKEFETQIENSIGVPFDNNIWRTIGMSPKYKKRKLRYALVSLIVARLIEKIEPDFFKSLGPITYFGAGIGYGLG